jgi:hypothetical protein
MIGLCGAYGTGGCDLDGRVANLDTAEGSLGSAIVTAEHEIDIAGNHRLWLYLDGVPVRAIEPGETVTTTSYGEAGVDVQVWIARATDTALPDLRGSLPADRLFVDWDPVTAADAVAYRVYTDNRTGTMVYSAPLVAVDDLVSTNTPAARAPDSGTGTGRITVTGTVAGTINATLSIEITGTTKWQYDVTGSGLNGVDLDIKPGVPVGLPNGQTVVFIDGAADYDTGDTWEWHVGPRTDILTGSLAAGTWQVAVTALDGAGNESSPSSILSAVTAVVLTPPGDPAATWDAAESEIVVTWTDPEDANVESVAIFASYNATTGAIGDYVLEANPIVTAPVEDGTASVSIPTARGTVLLYARSMDSAGNWEDNARLLTVEVADAPAAVLAAPVVASVAAGAGGSLVITAIVDARSGVPVAVNYYVGASASWGALSEIDSDAFVPDPDGVATITKVLAGPYSGTKYVGVRTEDEDESLSPESNIVAVVADSTAPSAPTLRVVRGSA